MAKGTKDRPRRGSGKSPYYLRRSSTPRSRRRRSQSKRPPKSPDANSAKHTPNVLANTSGFQQPSHWPNGNVNSATNGRSSGDGKLDQQVDHAAVIAKARKNAGGEEYSPQNSQRNQERVRPHMQQPYVVNGQSVSNDRDVVDKSIGSGRRKGRRHRDPPMDLPSKVLDYFAVTNELHRQAEKYGRVIPVGDDSKILARVFQTMSGATVTAVEIKSDTELPVIRHPPTSNPELEVIELPSNRMVLNVPRTWSGLSLRIQRGESPHGSTPQSIFTRSIRPIARSSSFMNVPVDTTHTVDYIPPTRQRSQSLDNFMPRLRRSASRIPEYTVPFPIHRYVREYDGNLWDNTYDGMQKNISKRHDRFKKFLRKGYSEDGKPPLATKPITPFSHVRKTARKPFESYDLAGHADDLSDYTYTQTIYETGTRPEGSSLSNIPAKHYKLDFVSQEPDDFGTKLNHVRTSTTVVLHKRGEIPDVPGGAEEERPAEVRPFHIDPDKAYLYVLPTGDERPLESSQKESQRSSRRRSSRRGRRSSKGSSKRRSSKGTGKRRSSKGSVRRHSSERRGKRRSSKGSRERISKRRSSKGSSERTSKRRSSKGSSERVGKRRSSKGASERAGKRRSSKGASERAGKRRSSKGTSERSGKRRSSKSSSERAGKRRSSKDRSKRRHSKSSSRRRNRRGSKRRHSKRHKGSRSKRRSKSKSGSVKASDPMSPNDHLKAKSEAPPEVPAHTPRIGDRVMPYPLGVASERPGYRVGEAGSSVTPAIGHRSPVPDPEADMSLANTQTSESGHVGESPSTIKGHSAGHTGGIQPSNAPVDVMAQPQPRRRRRSKSKQRTKQGENLNV